MHPIIKQYNNWGIIMCIMDVSHAKRQWHTQGFKTSFYYFYLSQVDVFRYWFLLFIFLFLLLYIIVLTIWIGPLTYYNCMNTLYNTLRWILPSYQKLVMLMFTNHRFTVKIKFSIEPNMINNGIDDSNAILVHYRIWWAKGFYKIHNLHDVTKGSTLNEPPYWILKINHINQNNIT
jgi:hypothetical protein